MAPCISGCLLCLPICLDTPHVCMPCTFGCLLCLDAPVCLDTHHTFRCPHMFGCPLYINNTKKACFVRLRVCPYAPIHLDAPGMFRCHHMFGCTPCMSECPNMFGWPSYVWTPPVCFNSPICLDNHLYVLVCPMFGHLSGWMTPHVWTPPVCLAAPHMFGCCQMYGGIQKYEGHPNMGAAKCMGAHMDTPSVYQSMHSLCCICTAGIQTSSKHTQGHPNIHRGLQTYGSVHRYSGGIQT